jgi:hypothetical protein
MMFLSRWSGVTFSDAERNLGAEQACCEEIVEKVLLMQSDAAAKQRRPLYRGTHAKGVTALARLEVFDVASSRDAALGARLTKGIFARPGIYPATVRFANSDPRVNSDLKPDVRSLSFSVDLTRDGRVVRADGVARQDFSLQNATTLPLNDARVFLATMKVLTASNPAKGLLSLPFRDQMSVVRVLALARSQARQKVRPYQQLRYWSTVPFRHGPVDIVKQSATPSPGNGARPLQRGNPDALKHELVRHLNEDAEMGSFDIGLQFLDTENMTYDSKPRDASFWIENASIEWKEKQAPFHTVARLTLMPRSQLSPSDSEAAYFDVTGNAAPDSTPVGSINRARWRAEVASREARTRSEINQADHGPPHASPGFAARTGDRVQH